MLARWLALLPAAVAMLAQDAPPSAGISGSVTNSVTGEPILRAHVTVYCSSEDIVNDYAALTNEKGEFSVSRLPAANCKVNAERVGFVPSDNETTYPLARGGRKDGVKLSLVPFGAITGRVLNAAGEPVQGADLRAISPRGDSGSAFSGDKGQFRIGGLRPGKYRVSARPHYIPLPPEIRSDGAVELLDVTTDHPERVEVKAGAEVSNVDIRLAQTPIVKVSGNVTGLPPGFKHASVNLMPEGVGAFVKADGTFTIWRPDPGKYTLQANYFEDSQLQSAPLDIEVGAANLEHLELRMMPAFDIAGQLRFDDEQAREAVDPPQPRSVDLGYLVRWIGGLAHPASIGADDSFTLEKVRPGRYRLVLSGLSGYVQSVRAGETETEGDVLDVRNGPPGPITVTVSSNFCEISGAVNDGTGPVANAPVLLVSVEDPSNIRVSRADSAGAYKFRVAPGKYTMAAIDEDAMKWGPQGPDLEDYQPESLDLSAGDKITKDLAPRK